MSSEEKKCFVIMPFSATKSHDEKYWERQFNLFLKPIIEKVKNVKAYRSEPLRGSISSQIILDLINSDIVVADLTDHNPNVLWELGVRQSFKHGTITIAEDNTAIPFHFSHKGILFYNQNHMENSEFEAQFIKSIEDCIKHPKEPDSPVLENISGRSGLYNYIMKEDSIRKIEGLITETEENTRILNDVISSLKRTHKMGVLLLNTLCLENLLVNRYLDNFNYQISYEACSNIKGLNIRVIDIKDMTLKEKDINELIEKIQNIASIFEHLIKIYKTYKESLENVK